MKTVGVVSYNIHCNFTNYGSALQSWALCKTIERLGYKPVLMDYCPDILRDKNPLDPFKNMWDRDEESQRMCEMKWRGCGRREDRMSNLNSDDSFTMGSVPNRSLLSNHLMRLMFGVGVCVNLSLVI